MNYEKGFEMAGIQKYTYEIMHLLSELCFSVQKMRYEWMVEAAR